MSAISARGRKPAVSNMKHMKGIVIRIENAYFHAVMVTFLSLFLLIGYAIAVFVNKNHHPKLWRRIGRICVVCLFIFCNVRMKTSGLENVPRTPCVIALNHRSIIDTLSLLAMLDRYFFVITEPFDAMPHPMIQAWVENFGYIPVIRDDRDKRQYKIGMDRKYVVKECIDRVRKGETLVIYPEAHHEKNKGMLKFKTGAVRIALGAGVPLIPGAFTGTEKVVTPEHHRVHPGTIHLRVGPALLIDQYYGKIDDRPLVVELTAQLRYEIKRLIP